MKVRELIERLNGMDPDATVYTYAYEYGGYAIRVLNSGDDLYFAADPAHDEGENHIYIVGR